MRPFGHGGGSRHQQKGAQESSTSQAGTSSSSFVSTLSNALNISTPNASKTTASQTPVYPDAHLSAPAKLGYGEHALGSTSEALRTPTRSREPPPMLSLSGHEAFQSPNAPISPWNTNSMLEVPTGSFAATHGNGSFAGRPSTSAAPDQEWLLSGPSSGRYSNIFDTDPATTSSATATSSASSGCNNFSQIVRGKSAPDDVRKGPATDTKTHPPHFTAFREHPTRFDRYETSIVQGNSSELSTLSTSNAIFSPLESLSASTSMDRSSLSSTFQQETPCLSNRLLPSNDLTEFLPIRSVSAHSGEGCLAFGLRVSNVKEQYDAIGADDRSLAGLGLDLNTDTVLEQIEVLTSPSQPLNRPAMIVDEMGRWMLDSRSQLSEGSWHSGQSAEVNKARRERWAAERASTSSLSTSTEASFTTYSNSTTWDSSFIEAASPTGGASSSVADSQFISTPASSIGFSGNSDPQTGRVANQLRLPSEPHSPLPTPEVAMHDFSEFGQSVSIEQMAEERWRTWPRTNGSAITHDRSLTSAAAVASTPTIHPVTEEPRASFDSLLVSTASTRSRLMAEPYDKNKRSGRPSSSTSTSSRSSIGNLTGLEDQQVSGITGPSRPRSYIAAGSLRMSSATRTNSSGGTGPDSGQVSGERAPSTAMALRRARGMSHSIFSPSSSSAMKSTRSAEAFVPQGSPCASARNLRHSVALQRSATSIEGPIKNERPQSMLDTSSHSESPRNPGAATKSKSSVGLSEVSAALDTLRMFLKQKSGSEGSDTHDESPKKADEENLPDKPSRTLRRVKGVLPPRGVDEFGALQTSASTSNAAAPNDVSISSAHHRSQSLGGSFSMPMPASQSSFSRQDDKLAVLEDLSERVLRLKAENELERERDAAASMPPPAARPASTMHQRTQSSMTRREMHEEYIRKRASGT
ncbi:uncharacterized protein SPSC_02950 [Sporisorium scitamineum]|uniref:Uncharacterized protein n=2 Tax=Sporisorium scitamineum TaxID=49012 RepID=A0A127Z648_9BASI|nr:uncharacterized protein SPSC_02950 [Sporisorium scitamineum]